MSEELEPLYDKKVKCPICASEYTTKKIRSRFIKVEKIEPDFFTHYKDQALNPMLYEINVCPKCGYSYADSFSSTFPHGSKDLIKAQITSNWSEQDYSGKRQIKQAISTYKLAILSGALKEEKSVVMAGLCIRLAWLYRTIGNPEEEIRFVKLALEKYKRSYMEADYIGTQLSEIRLLYVIGELCRQIGDGVEAIKNFSKVIHHKNRSSEVKLIEMAREQWYLIRDGDKAAQ